jgi:hypothetical protein
MDRYDYINVNGAALNSVSTLKLILKAYKGPVIKRTY